MKKFLPLFLTVILLSFFSINALAAGINEIQIGNGGEVIGGYYTQNPTLVFKQVGASYSSSGVVSPSDECILTGQPGSWGEGDWGSDRVYEYNLEGVHTFKLWRNQYRVNYVQIDDGSFQVDGHIFNSGNYPGCDKFKETPTTLIDQKLIKLDVAPPQISILSPAPSSNFDTDSVTVSGTAGDTGSGVKSVTVNGKTASLSGNDFAVAIDLVRGMNTFTAIATDYTNRTAISQVTVFRYEDIKKAPKKSSTGDTGKKTLILDSATLAAISEGVTERNKVYAKLGDSNSIILFGKVEVSVDLTLKVNSSKEIVENLKSDDVGFWFYNLTEDIGNGDHSAFVEYVSASGGKVITDKLNFSINNHEAANNYLLYGSIASVIILISVIVFLQRSKIKKLFHRAK